METKPITFALYFGNRGFFPESLIAGAREEMIQVVLKAGYKYIIPDLNLTRYGAVETKQEGIAYAAWIKEHQGEYDGVILSLPNFGDENGAFHALRDCGTPILIQAYPDEIGKMDFAHRRDAYCGKFSIEDIFYQAKLPFTVLAPHVVSPLSEAFGENLKEFAATCRVVRGMKRFTIGAIGARTTKFKTVRFDEITLQKYDITVETFDLSELFMRVGKYADDDPKIIARMERLRNYTNCSHVPEENMNRLAKLSVVIDDFIEQYGLDCVTIRCWEEMQPMLRVAPCVLLSELNDRGVVASCEIDLCSAINMYALMLASETPATVLDWNNNYGEDPNKVILFHCGPVPQTLMTEKGTVTDHKMFAKADPGCGWGSNEGRIRAFPFTFSNCKTENGKLILYACEGKFTNELIEEGFFGCAGVAEIAGLQDKLLKLGRSGFRHHTAVGEGHVASALKEAFSTYLGYEIFEL
jgi:L-fucose isomerase-like protein